MQSSSEQPLVGRIVRDDPNNGCEGDSPRGTWAIYQHKACLCHPQTEQNLTSVKSLGYH